jgi:hypothetical protein
MLDADVMRDCKLVRMWKGSVRDGFPNDEKVECEGMSVRDGLPNDEAIQKYARVDWERRALLTLCYENMGTTISRIKENGVILIEC